MNRKPVESNNIKSIGWESVDPVHGTLEIEFIRGAVYQFRGVPVSVFQSFEQAESKGKFFHQVIKNRYETVKIQEEQNESVNHPS